MERGTVMEPMQGKWASSRLDLGHTELFCVPEVSSVFFWFVPVFFGTLRSSIKQIEASYVFDWETVIALHAMRGNRASSLSKGDVSCFCLQVQQEPGVYS